MKKVLSIFLVIAMALSVGTAMASARGMISVSGNQAYASGSNH